MNDHDNAWRQILVDLTMLATGSVTSWNKSGATGKPGHRVLADTTTNTRSIADVFQARWDGCRDDLQRESVIEAAREHIRLEQGRDRDKTAVKEETREECDARILDAAGWKPDEIALSSEYMRTSAYRVRNLRRAAGQDPETGRVDESTLEMKRLAKHGKSVRQIADELGMKKDTVHRRLKRAA